MPKQATRKRATPKDKRLPTYIEKWLTHGRAVTEDYHARRAESDECYEAALALFFLDHGYEPPWVAEHVITRSKLREWGYGAQLDSLIAAGKIGSDRE